MTSIQRAGHSNLLIGGIAALSIVALTVSVLVPFYTISRIADDEQCLRSVVSEQTARSAALSPLGMRRDHVDALRTDASNARQNAAAREQHWQAVEQRLFLTAFSKHPTGHRLRKVQGRFIHAAARFVVAGKRYDRADKRYRALNARWSHLNDLYNQAAQAHPLPKLKCNADGLTGQAAPIVHVTSTATAHSTVTAHATTTATAAAPPAVTRTRQIPGPVRTIHVRQPRRTVTRTQTVYAPPGQRHKHRGRHR